MELLREVIHCTAILSRSGSTVQFFLKIFFAFAEKRFTRDAGRDDDDKGCDKGENWVASGAGLDYCCGRVSRRRRQLVQLSLCLCESTTCSPCWVGSSVTGRPIWNGRRRWASIRCSS